MTYKRVVLLIVLIFGNTISLPADLNGSEIKKGSVFIYAVSDDNPDACGMNLRLELGDLPVWVDSSNVVTAFVLDEDEGYRIPIDPFPNWTSISSDIPGRVAFYPDLGGMFSDGRNDGWRRDDKAYRWWQSQLMDTTTSYCGYIRLEPFNRWDSEPKPSDPELANLRGVIITNWPASLKLTVTGPHVKVEPMEACCSPEGECVEQVLWQRPTLCPEGTSPAGKASNHHRCIPAEEITGANPIDKPPDGEQEENRGCCLPGGKCSNLSPEKCGMIYGIPLQGPCGGEDDPACNELTGACEVEGKCEPSQTADNCKNALRGEFKGPGSKCTQPELVMGACCDGKENEWGEGGCSIETEKSCADRREKDKTTFLPGVTSCESNPCPKPEPETRACCYANGECSLMTKELCEGEGIEGTFLKDVKTCESDPCKKSEPPKGGCCNGFGTCISGVLEANCQEAGGNTFFPEGCPETCPDLRGACHIPCPTSKGKEDCIMVSEKRCASIGGSRFEPDKKCEETGCLNCTSCEIASGRWILNLPDEHATLILNKDCTSRMVIKKKSDDNTDGLPITHPSQEEMDGFWGCFDQKIQVSWGEDSGEIELIMAWESGTMKLCYPDGDKMICAERSQPITEVTVEFKGTIKGPKERSQP